MANHRYITFWPQDWVNDPALNACSIEAKGLWIDLICMAHGCEPYGHLTVNGAPMPVEHIAKTSRINPRTVRKLLNELGSKGVFSRTSDGVIYCRRMVRDSQKSKQGQQSAERRWGRKEGPEPSGSPTGPPSGSPNASLQNHISKSYSYSNAREGAAKEEVKNSGFKVERSEGEENSDPAMAEGVERVVAFTAKALTFKRPYGEVRTKNEQLDAIDPPPRLGPAHLTPEQLAIVRGKRS